MEAENAALPVYLADLLAAGRTAELQWQLVRQLEQNEARR